MDDVVGHVGAHGGRVVAGAIEVRCHGERASINVDGNLVVCQYAWSCYLFAIDPVRVRHGDTDGVTRETYVGEGSDQRWRSTACRASRMGLKKADSICLFRQNTCIDPDFRTCDPTKNSAGYHISRPLSHELLLRCSDESTNQARKQAHILIANATLIF